MKKYTLLALTLSLCGALLVGCGCTNTGNITTTPTTEFTKPTTQPTTAPTAAPTTMPTTMPTTEAPSESGSGDMESGINGETAGDNGVVGEDGTSATDMPAARGRRIRPMG